MNGNNARTFTPLYDDFHTELKGGAAWAYAAIYRFCMMRNGECTASNETLAEAARLPIGTFRRHKKWLEDNGYITNTEGLYGNSTRVLRINHDAISDVQYEQGDVQYEQGDVQYEQGGVLTMDRRLLTMSNKDTIKILNKDTNKIPPQDTGNVDEEMSQSGIEVNISKEKDPAAEAALKKIFKSYEDEIGIITKTIADKIQIYLDDGINPQWIIDAIRISSENNARRWSYVEGILKRWIAQGNQNDYRQKVDNTQFPAERGWSTV